MSCLIISLAGFASNFCLQHFKDRLLYWEQYFHWMFLAWAIAFCAQYYLLFRFEKHWSQKLQFVLHPLTLHLLIFILTWECAWMVDRGVNGAKTWELAVWGGAPGLMVLMLVMFGSRLSWLVRRFLSYYTGKGLTPVMTYLLCWTIFSCFFNGNPSPLSYFPIIKPLEIIGVSFLGIAVIKLFFIDLDSIGMVARIISFMVVGILMLVIGYFSPLPPKQQIQNN
jgi:hypothetical protein